MANISLHGTLTCIRQWKWYNQSKQSQEADEDSVNEEVTKVYHLSIRVPFMIKQTGYDWMAKKLDALGFGLHVAKENKQIYIHYSFII